MTNILRFTEISKASVPLAGGKGAQLGELYNLGFPVPKGFVITSLAYQHFLEANRLSQGIGERLAVLNVENTQALEATAQEIQRIILNAPMPRHIAEEIAKNYKKLTGYVAVRSSATAEDLPEASFAGQQSTFLNVSGAENVVEAVKKCFASLFTARAIYYRAMNKFEHMKVLIAVVVQRMVEAEKAGVMFTINPVTNNREEIIIEAAFGLGEAVVAGEITPDSYIIDKKTDTIVDKNISVQNWGYFREDGVTVKKDIDFGHLQTLSEAEIKGLVHYGKKIEQHYNWPQDIEWAIDKKGIKMLQARPVTTIPSPFLDETNKTKTKKLEKIFSREHNMLYFELWHKSDLAGLQLFGEKLPQHLFIVMPRGQQGSVWYKPEGMTRAREKLIETFRGPKGNLLLKKLTKYQEKNWAYLGHYILGKRFIKNWPELKRFYIASANYWVSMNSFIWENLDDPRMPAFVRKTILSWRKRSEAYSERANALKFIDTTYPHLRDITWFLTLAEFERVVKGKATKAKMKQFLARRDGCFILNGKVYPLHKLDTQLHAHKLELHEVSETDKKELTGTAVYGGVVRSTIKIISGFSDLEKIQENDVLVASMTQPDYVATMRKVAAIVTDEGGALCHAAIVAREMKKPCIVGTKIATKVLKDGDLVEVDADKGVVKLLPK